LKFATLKAAGRDGRLIMVSRDLAHAVHADAAPTLQAALDRWAEVKDALESQYRALNADEAPGSFAFDPAQALAPLPRAYQWLDASSYLKHGRLLDQAFNIAPIPQADVVPIMYQGGSDSFLPPVGAVPFVNEADGIDFEAEFALILGDVPLGAQAEQVGDSVRLVVLINDWSLRNLQKFEMMRGFGPIHAKPATGFAPVAVTPDELGEAWRDERIHLRVQVSWNDQPFGHPDGGAMDYRYSQLIAHAARTRELRAGAILGFGTVSEGEPDKVGSACIAERRGFEVILHGAPKTEFMKFGDRVRIEVLGADGASVFGAIDQTVAKLDGRE
jgi:fumarylacetoacetate (FAA) hydrolase